jgi:predicted aspartyl protease
MQRRRLLLSGAAACGLAAARLAFGQPAGMASVPLRLLRTGDIGALPFIEIVLGGEPTRWLVDSGATTALITPALAARLNLRRHFFQAQVATAGGVQKVDRFALPALPVLGPVADASALAIDLGDLFGPAGVQVDGLLGAPWLRGGATTFDFARGELRWSPVGAAPPPGAIVLPLRWDDALPVLRLAIGERAAEDFLFDTGNAGALVVFVHRAQTLLANAGHLPATTARELGGTVRAYHARIERLAAPGVTWRDVPAVLESGTTARRGGHFDRLSGSLGAALFEAGAVTLDAAGEHLVIELPGLPDPLPLPGGFGMTLGTPGGAGLAISAVIEGSPAAAAGVEAADTVTAIDGSSTLGWTTVDAWQALAGRSAAEFELSRAGSAPRRVRLERQRFFPLLR